MARVHMYPGTIIAYITRASAYVSRARITISAVEIRHATQVERTYYTKRRLWALT
jgi:hypothetical protein